MYTSIYQLALLQDVTSVKKKDALLSLTLTVFLVLPVFAFAPTTAVAQTPKIMKIGMFDEPDSLNPILAAEISSWEFINWIYDPLVRWDDNWGIQPCLAESWEWAANGSQLVMHIDPDATWHDGTPFTAYDANWTLFTWTWLGYWVAQTPRIDHRNIKVPDDYTLVLNFVDDGYENIWYWDPGGSYGDPAWELGVYDRYNGTPVQINQEAFLTGLTYVPILPEHLWDPLTWHNETYGIGSWYWDVAYYWDAIVWGMYLEQDWPTPMIGTGAFMLDEYKVGEYIRLDANPDYHLGAPNIDEILITFYSTIEVMTEAVKAGDIDFCETAPAFIELGTIPSTVTINENPWMGWEGLLVNQFVNYTYANGTGGGFGEGKVDYTSNPRKVALRQPEVKKAINQAIDKAQIAEVAYLGHANAADSLIHTTLKWHNDELITYPKGIAAARATLEAAGWVENLAGVYQKNVEGTDETLSFTIKYVTGVPTDFTIVSLVSAYLEAAGFDITTIPLEETTFTAETATEMWNFDIALTFYSQIADPNSMMQYMTSDSWINPNAVNITRVDEIYKEQQLTTSDVTRAALCDEFQQIMYNDSSIIVLVEFTDIELYRNDAWTFTHTDWQSGILSMWNIDSWLEVDVPTTPTTTTPTTGTTTPPPQPPPLPMELLLVVGIGAVVLVLVVVLVIRKR
ncbi:MAG: ABC transporter substrate-binding protein [Candidatus Thorarchaeota archaeon]